MESRNLHDVLMEMGEALLEGFLAGVEELRKGYAFAALRDCFSFYGATAKERHYILHSKRKRIREKYKKRAMRRMTRMLTNPEEFRDRRHPND